MTDLLSALNNSTRAMADARVAMRRGRAVMRLQRIQLRRARRIQRLLGVASGVQSLSIAAVLLSSCDVYHEPQLHEVTPICEIAIDHLHGTSETHGDCDAGEW